MLLELKDVSLQLEAKTLIAPISLALDAGEQAVITGPSGSGKSTLLKLIAWLLSASGGEILLDGQRQQAFSPQQWRQQVSWCAQTPALFGATVRDNLLFPWQVRKKTPQTAQLTAWLARVNLATSMLDKPIGELSGGEKQRVALLRNLQFTPQVLLLDEVTSALDVENGSTVRQLIDELVSEQSMAALWVSHNRDEIAAASRVITLQPPSQEAPRESA